MRRDEVNNKLILKRDYTKDTVLAVEKFREASRDDMPVPSSSLSWLTFYMDILAETRFDF